MATNDLQNIDWAEVAARARADLGDERVARFSERLRTTMMLVEGSVRPPGRESPPFGSMPPLGAT
jgi:hypothetical protein